MGLRGQGDHWGNRINRAIESTGLRGQGDHWGNRINRAIGSNGKGTKEAIEQRGAKKQRDNII
jgi:hypothetical protein